MSVVELTQKQINHIESAIAFCLYCKIIEFDMDDLCEMKELEKKFKELREKDKV